MDAHFVFFVCFTDQFPVVSVAVRNVFIETCIITKQKKEQYLVFVSFENGIQVIVGIVRIIFFSGQYVSPFVKFVAVSKKSFYEVGTGSPKTLVKICPGIVDVDG